MPFWIPFLGSLFLVSLGQPSLLPAASPFTSAFGLALFWKGMLHFSERKKRFWIALLWFAAVQAIQLSWMTSTHYMGPLILVVYAFLSFAIGFQFGAISLLISRETPLSLLRCLAASGGWVFLEWMRLLPLTGFPWNPLGLSLTTASAIQFASLFGIYGLSFWVFFVNCLGLNALFLEKTLQKRVTWALAACAPYLFGWGEQLYVEYISPVKKTLSAALVQTALLPEQRDSLIPPLDQWERVFSSLRGKREKIDLLLFPEAAFPYGAHRAIYPLELVQRVWKLHFGSFADLPPLESPLAQSFQWEGGKVHWKVTNAYLAQALANHFSCDLIIGLDAEEGKKNYNAAFHFHPGQKTQERYEKRILMPIAEYIPLSHLQFLVNWIEEEFGIDGSFGAGKEAKVFSTLFSSSGISICAEETYPHIMRQIRERGAEMFASISNDAWFPRTRLPKVHFEHGRVRAAENGVFLLRSCNTGITCVIDCFGRTIASLPPSEEKGDILFTSFSLRSFKTPYLLWGDAPLLSLSALFLCLFFWKEKFPSRRLSFSPFV